MSVRSSEGGELGVELWLAKSYPLGSLPRKTLEEKNSDDSLQDEEAQKDFPMGAK